jgi:hypothetical protein
MYLYRKMDLFINELVNFIVLELKKTPLNKEFDIAKIKAKIAEFVADVILKLDKKDTNVMLSFVKNNKLFQECLLPNVSKILADGKLNLDDVPFFLDTLLGIYTNINSFVQENPTVTISSNDMVELAGLLLKTTLSFLVNNPIELNTGISIINNSIKLVKFTVQNKSKSCKLFCCCK